MGVIETGAALESLLTIARQKGSDKQFLDWLSYQPSCLDGTWNQWDIDKGKGRNIACHVRRIRNGAGLGIKPDYSAVPMTDTQHKIQSGADGEARVLNRFKRRGSGFWTPLCASDWFDEQRIIYLQQWIGS